MKNKVKCNKCSWEEDEDNLSLFEYNSKDKNETITAVEYNNKIYRRAERPKDVSYFKDCFQCETDEYLMDI